ncbi:MAG: hypothetical protein LBH00_11760 [Planctomycetaceae bacterium]|jgi:hypothetical protein|nr:hypothetical protein [Planctomycetaceae bacterium]
MIRKIPAFCFFVLAVYATAAAEEYRIDNVVRGVKSTALLLDGKFYSIIEDNGEIVEFDSHKKIFTLIDPSLRIQTQINAAEMRKKITDMQQKIAGDPKTDKESFAYFAANPVFTSESDTAAGRIVLQSRWIDYEITAVPFHDKSSEMYYDFCDWMCYLNLRINPFSSAVLTRLTVNRLLREEKKFPVSVSVAIYPKGKQGFSKPDKAESSHKIVRRFSEPERKQIGQINELKQKFPQVSFEEYQKQVAGKK